MVDTGGEWSGRSLTEGTTKDVAQSGTKKKYESPEASSRETSLRYSKKNDYESKTSDSHVIYPAVTTLRNGWPEAHFLLWSELPNMLRHALQLHIHKLVCGSGCFTPMLTTFPRH